MRLPRRGASARDGVGMATQVGSLDLRNVLMTASGTAGHGAELGAFVPLEELGAVVVKSLAAEPWPGNPAPRVHATRGGMINSVGLQGPGVEAWMARELPELERAGATVVASIWGRTVAEFEKAATMLAGAPDSVIAVEVNVSCPNLEDRRNLFAHSTTATEDVLAATAVVGRPRWAKLSPNTPDLVEIAAAARQGGAEAVTLVNTVLGMAIDVETRRPVLGAGRGGLSGPAIHPVAVRAVYDVRAALADLPIVAAGGVASASDVVEFLLAGASAVQVGTATFADPATLARLLVDVPSWCARHGLRSVRELIGAAHQN